jgi:predicted alpha/beta superfamily hydrolase
MKTLLLSAALLLSSLGFSQSDSIKTEPFTIGERITLHSEILGVDRVLNIYLPYGYHADSAKTYPVIYLLDGSEYEDFIHVVGVVQFGSYPWINMIEESIVVGIENIDRKHDFTYPTRDEEHKKEYPTTGASADFIAFIAEELQPMIASTYNVTEEKTIIGQSLGGLLATEILYKQPDLFTNYIIVSPSLWWDFESLFETTRIQSSSVQKVYVGVGEEGKTMKRVAKKLYKTLKKDESFSSYYNFFPENDHGDVLHLAVYDAFNQLFKTPLE